MKQGNLNIRCTEDYAVLYWDKPAAPSGAEYTVSLNGEAVGRTDRTHFTIEGLSYGSSFRVDVVSGSYCIGSATLQFGREKRRIDITAAPYFCKGDGHILNTDNLQRAINDCGADDILYVPAGGCTAIWKFIWPRARCCRAQRTFTTIRPASPAGLRAPRCAATQAF